METTVNKLVRFLDLKLGERFRIGGIIYKRIQTDSEVVHVNHYQALDGEPIYTKFYDNRIYDSKMELPEKCSEVLARFGNMRTEGNDLFVELLP